MALYLREIQPPPKYLHASNPLRFPPQIGVVTSQIAFSKFFNVLPQPVLVWWWCASSSKGQTGVKLGLSSLCYWQTETSCFAVVSLKENTSDMKSFVLTGPDLSCILRQQWRVLNNDRHRSGLMERVQTF